MVTIFSEAFSQVIVCITFENSFQRYNNRGNTDLHIPLFISSLPVVLCQTQALEEAAKIGYAGRKMMLKIEYNEK